MKILNENLKTLWAASGLTQKEFSERMGSNQKAFWTYLNGSAPNGQFLLKICDSYGVDIGFLETQRLIAGRDGKIKNLPNYAAHIKRLKRKAEKINERFNTMTKELSDEIGSLITEVERLERKRTR
jgi:transcriptional regulator with XRE-family HTH domain